ncbi:MULTISPECIES: helix-turn-helix domain-containing protein [Amycolatopsis]|uniref:helix-turn-helix domain-containing protein n=1 Tax=Amycolatopsis TaxID=1813 RepID=UPI0007DF1CA2|nr:MULTISPECIES: helix-turn-helix domain-containing protein [Amycolatopsis]OAP24178.1 hypothetical protein A4R44_04951 [Amycolatopsis sp. M39]
MSIEAINWALKHARIPEDRRDSSSLAVVLIGLANHADPEGRNAFPSLATLASYTRLTERSVRYALRNLEQLGLIQSADPRIVAAHVQRADRRPNGYDLVMASDGPAGRGQRLPSAGQHEGQNTTPRAANNHETGGNPCPRTIHKPSINHPSRRSPRLPEPIYLPPPCGRCDARPGDPASTRSTTDEDGNVRRCPNCHPAEVEDAPGQPRHPPELAARSEPPVHVSPAALDDRPPLRTPASSGGTHDGPRRSRARTDASTANPPRPHRGERVLGADPRSNSANRTRAKSSA